MAGEWMAVPQSVLKPLAQNRPKSWNPLLSFKQRQNPLLSFKQRQNPLLSFKQRQNPLFSFKQRRKRTNELVLPRPRILYELTASAVTHSSPRLGIYT